MGPMIDPVLSLLVIVLAFPWPTLDPACYRVKHIYKKVSYTLSDKSRERFRGIERQIEREGGNVG